MSNLETREPSKAMFWIGWVLTAIPVLMLGSGSILAISRAPMVVEGVGKYGYAPSIVPILGCVELLIAVLMLIPRTAVVGTILLSAYMGGAVATHARAGEPQWIVPVVFALIGWVGLFLRRPWLRQFLRQH